MKNLVKVLAFVFASMIFAPAMSVAQDNVIAGVEVQLVDSDGKTVSRCTTSPTGTCKFDVKSAGDYSLVVTEKQYQVAMRAIKSPDDTNDDSDDVSGKRSKKGYDAYMSLASHEVVSPRDPASGLATGKRQPSSGDIIQQLDKATPLLFKATGACTISCTLTYKAKAGKTGKTK